MTYPNPYQPPQVGYGGYGQDPRAALLGPARRAGVLMIIMGVVGVLCGGCFGIVGANWQQFISQAQVPADQMEMLQEIEAQAHTRLGTILLAVAVVFGIVSIIELFLGFIVRRGGKVSCIIGIIFTSIILLVVAIDAVGSVINALRINNPSAVGGVCMLGVIAALFVLQLIWLIQAVRNSGRFQAASDLYQQQYQQHQQQYWQYAQQQQAMGQQPMQNPYAQAYGLQPPPPPPASPNAPPQPPAGQPPVSGASDQQEPPPHA